MKKQKILLVALLLILPLTLLAGGKIVYFLSQAAPIPANIVVDASASQAKLARPWQALSQGGEQEVPGRLVSLSPVTPQIRKLETKFVRIDHVLEEPFENTLRSRIQQIVDSGATPIISLSYFPSSVASSNIGTPANYANWRQKVKHLVEEVSGKSNLNVQNAYYEVWNEPDGENFGNFDIGEGKDYFELYQQSERAVQMAENVNSFKFGGPALADLRRCDNGLLFVCQTFWLDRFLNLVSASKTRLDFISWHRYSTNLDDYKEDVNFINNLYIKYASLPPAEKILTEWGSTPERNPVHNTVFDAAHLVAAARAFIGHIDIATKFEIRDGPDSKNSGWGIISHNGTEKPTYKALEFLNKLRSERVLLTGEGTNVTGIASRDSGGVTLILSNFDRNSRHVEKVPIKIKKLIPGNYLVTKTILDYNFPLGKETKSSTRILQGTFKTEETMFPNSIILLDLMLIGFQNISPS